MPRFLCWMWPNYRGCWDGRLKMPWPWIHSDCRLHSCTSELSRISKSFLCFAKAKGSNAALISALWSSDIQTHLSVLFFKLFFFFWLPGKYQGAQTFHPLTLGAPQSHSAKHPVITCTSLIHQRAGRKWLRACRDLWNPDSTVSSQIDSLCY